LSNYDYLAKIIVVGDGAVGKTAITIRFAEGRFDEQYKMTIGVDFAMRIVKVRGYRIKLQIWDTGGQEQFAVIRPLYYKGARAAIVVFDITNRESFEHIIKWVQEVSIHCGKIPYILVGNKSDLPDRAITYNEGEQAAQNLGIPYFETSAKDGSNINEIFVKLMEILLGI